MSEPHNYTEDNIRSLEWDEHIRLRPGMYIGKLGDGSHTDDGIYILLKEVLDNSIDEYVMGHGKKIEVNIRDGKVTVRDFGRGIPLGKLVEVVSQMNTGAKYDSKAFKKSVGLNGVGTKAVNALSSHFEIHAVRDGKIRKARFIRAKLQEAGEPIDSADKNGTYVEFVPDEDIFRNFQYRIPYVERMLWNYCYLNKGLVMVFNGQRMVSENGLKDLLQNNMDGEAQYPIVHLEGEDIEVAFTHNASYTGTGDFSSFVNGQHTTQGGTHESAFKENVARVIREFFGGKYEAPDIREGMVAAVSIKVVEPVFESQTKTKLGSQEMEPGGQSVKGFIYDFLREKLDNFLHRNPETVQILETRIKQNERDRKELQGIQKKARERAKKASIHNRKLRDCRVHLTDLKDDRRLETTLFITEGDSASGSITKSRDVNTQAVFSLRGKPLNSYGLTKKVVYENEEFYLVQAALDIEDDVDKLRYNRIVVATDADVDGMHIRLLLLTFFLQFFPDIVRKGHVYILQTPLFRVRNKKETIYCYSEEERKQAIAKLGKNPEITRFKGLGEISPDEFKVFIGQEMRLEQVMMGKDASIEQILSFYMGKNTPERQDFIIDNLKVEKDLAELEEA
jgi:topoisomerase-4 subunit B